MNFTDFVRFIEKRKLFTSQEKILLAVSGGIDSSVMVDLFHRSKFDFAIAHCNFGLRGAESDEDSRFVKKMAETAGVALFTNKFNTVAYAQEKGISIQMAARELRYSWFEEVRAQNGYDYIATAHHLDDQAETFLINLIRGTGIAGLHGIQARKGKVIRPLLFAFRSEIETYATENQILFREDRSNNETKYLRNKIRHELIPWICSVNPEFNRGLSETISRVSEFEQIGTFALEEWRKRIIKYDKGDIVIAAEELLKATPVETFAWKLLSPFGFNESQLNNILSCINREGRKIFISPTHRLVKERNILIISPIQQKKSINPVTIKLFARRKSLSHPVPLIFTRYSPTPIDEIPATGKIATLDFNKLQFPLTVRRWMTGDAFYPLGMRKKKKLSDFFIDQKISLRDKEDAWLLCSGKDIVWIIGYRIDHRFRVTQATKEILSVRSHFE